MENEKHFDGLEYSEETIHGLEVGFFEITTRAMARHMGRSMGKYTTIQTGRLKELCDWNPAIECLAECLRRLWQPQPGKPLLIVGMGNRDYIWDSLGAEVAKNIPAYLISQMETPCVFDSVHVLTPGTQWQTNIDYIKIISGMAQVLDAAQVLLIDACGVSHFEEMSSVIYLSTGGLKAAGSGRELTREAIGVPLLVASAPLLLAILPETVKMLHLKVDEDGIFLMDTHLAKDYAAASAILSQGILRALYPELDLEELRQLVQKM